MSHHKIVVAFFGLPGAGKGVQADKVCQEYGLYNFDTGRLLESIWVDPLRKDDPIVVAEKKNFETGKLTDPSFVLNEVSKAVRVLADKGEGVVFSGSPRTLFEAEGLLPVLEDAYGRENLFFFFLDVDPLLAAARNARRMTCPACLPPVPPGAYDAGPPTTCPRCQTPLYRRKLDVPTAIPVRHKEFHERTKPVVEYIKGKNYPVPDIDGEKSAEEVFVHVKEYIKKRSIR